MVNYFDILDQQIADYAATFNVVLRPDCPVYAGHFPGNPVAPGACTLEMIRECASKARGKELRLKQIKQCKFKQLLRPNQTQQLTIQIEWIDSQINATVTSDNQVAMQVKMIAE